MKKPKTKGATFTYVGWKKILSYLKKTNLQISFKTENTIAELLTQNNKNTNFNKFNKSGTYQLTCQDWNKYFGQTGYPST